MHVCTYVRMCVCLCFLHWLDSTLDFLRPGDFSSKLRTYFVSEGDNVTLIMDTDANNYSEEVAFRVCRHDLSSVNQSDSCCDCFSRNKCEWGILKSSSSPQHICLFMTSQPGLYQFEIYTSHFPCYQKLGSPIKISKISSEENHNTFPRSLVYIISGCIISITSILLTIITYQVYKRVRARRKRKAKDTYYVAIYVAKCINFKDVKFSIRIKYQKLQKNFISFIT